MTYVDSVAENNESDIPPTSTDGHISERTLINIIS